MSRECNLMDRLWQAASKCAILMDSLMTGSKGTHGDEDYPCYGHERAVSKQLDGLVRSCGRWASGRARRGEREVRRTISWGAT